MEPERFVNYVDHPVGATPDSTCECHKPSGPHRAAYDAGVRFGYMTAVRAYELAVELGLTPFGSGVEITFLADHCECDFDPSFTGGLCDVCGRPEERDC
jgi:hypothetical protein